MLNWSWGRSPNRGREAPENRGWSSIEGEAQVEGTKRLRIEGETQTEGEVREKTGEGFWGEGLVSPSSDNFWKIKIETIPFGVCLK